MKIDIQAVCAQLAAATINGVYQGILIALFVGLVLRLLVRTNAATRHAVWFACLVLLASIIPAHYWLQGRAPGLNAQSDEGATAEGNDSVKPSAIPFEPSGESESPFDFNLPGLVEAPAAQPTPEVSPAWDSPAAPPPLALSLVEEPAFAAPPRSLLDHGVPASIVNQLWGVLTRGLRWATDRGIALVSWRLETQLGWPLLATILAVGLVIAGARLALLAWRLRQLRRLTDGSQPAGAELLQLFGRLRARGGVRRSVELRVSGQHRSPLVVGFFRPVILLPVDLAARGAWLEAEHVLGHELAHVRRYDDWANLFQHFIQAACFFHPAVWWIGKRLSLEREIACDDHVLQQGSGRRNYALILTSVASRIHQRTPLLAPGVSNNHSQLQQRISMILDTRRNSSPGLAKGRLASIISAAALIAVLALYTGPRFLLAQSASASAAAPAAAASIGENSSSASASTDQVSESAAPAAVVAGIDAGPKFKPENPGQDQAEPVEVTPPEPPEPPSINVNVDVDPQPMPKPHVARMAKPGKAPRSPGAEDMNDGDGSIEQRLKRLEKMVQSLMSQDKPRNAHGNLYLKEGMDQDFKFDFKDKEKANRDMERLKESAERQAARAGEQAKRAEEQAKRFHENMAQMEQDQHGNREPREAFQRQLEALRKAREGLGQEMEKLDHQIQKLEKEQQRNEKEQRSEKEQPRRSQTRAERLQAEISQTPELAE